ncbi:TetR/AcrR family transcriptional regulator [Holdemanella sp.]|uniref:TetR/AcrR family transcriptional regulator n=1 Tax=Holdemanella sp. TaxID=1971762 RepID=UPI002E75F1F5|nr:TetR/AcrR family transcriptional regulator [Holdemanella sp.]MEE0466628.1 TetR/AcrR family transcriptional regulator [Holdemanella sp.]
MNEYEKFLELPNEKQLKIINAGFEYFGKYGYKGVNTEDIANRAGISKGLLFYYFKNKESYYLFLCEFCQNLMLESFQETDFQEITDFFELIDFATKAKLKIITEYPFITDFSVNLIADKSIKVGSKSEEYVNNVIYNSFDIYFKNIDFTPFKEEIDVKKIYQMMLWLSEGYINEKKRINTPIILEDFLSDFALWKALFKKICYKEEYL